MPVSRLDAAASADTNSLAYTISAGSNRGLIVGVTQEVASPVQLTPVTYGGQTMTQIDGILVGDSTDQRVDMYWLNEAGIAAASGNLVVITSPPATFTIHAASYEDCVQTTPSVTDTHAVTGAGTTILGFTTQDDGVAVCLGGMGNDGTVVWSGGVTEQTEQSGGTTALGSLADELIGTGAAETYTATWTTANRRAGVGCFIGFLSVLERDQEAFRYYEDGTESGAAALENQNVDLTIAKQVIFQTRVGCQYVGDPAAEAGTLQTKESGDAATEWRDV